MSATKARNKVLALTAMLLLFVGPPPGAGADVSSARHPKVLIFVYDAGETFGLLPVAPLLEREQVDLRWVPLTPWSLRIVREKQQSYIQPPDDLDAAPQVKDRDATGDLGFWLNSVEAEKPDLVILGLVSRVQEQLAHELHKRGIRTAGFYDSFDPTTRDTTVARVARAVDTVWAPTGAIERNLKELGVKSTKVLGQPTVETWYRVNTDPANLYARLGIPPGKKIVLFAGQYGEGYPEILAAFMSAAVSELEGDPDLYLVISPHPRTGGEQESEALKKHPHPRARLMPAGINTAEVAAISSAVATWRSTVGTQAAFLGKPVLYFNFNRNDYTNDLIKGKLAIASMPSTFGNDLRQALSAQRTAGASRRRLLKLGYVIDADQKIAAEIVRLLRVPQPRSRAVRRA